MKSEIPDMIITIKENDMEYTRNLRDDVTIDDPQKINEYLVTNPGKTAFWNMRWQACKTALKRAELRVDTYRASLDKKIWEKAEEDEIELRESEIKSLILLDDKYQELQENYLKLLEQEGYLKAAVEAMKTLYGALRDLSANYRSEYHSGITVREKYEQGGRKVKQEEIEAINDMVDENLDAIRKRFG